MKPSKTIWRQLPLRLSPRVVCAAITVMVFVTVGVVGGTVVAVHAGRAHGLVLLIPGLLCIAATWGFACFLRVLMAAHRKQLARLENENASMRKTLIVALESFAYAVEARTNRNVGHLARVQVYALAIARAMKLSAEEVEGIGVAALLHDIGRLGVPDNILGKEGSLTDQEHEKVRAYPVLGARLLMPIPFPWPVVPMVRHHREHYDGSGYPDGLKRQKIPLGARIIAVADAYDRFLLEEEGSTEDRQERALANLQQAAGKQFDPEVIDAFLSVLDRANEQIAQQANQQDKHRSAFEISRAQREVQSLYDLACSVGSTLCLNETLEILADKIPGIVGCSACVIFLRSGSGKELEACIARGVNETYFRRSRARPGAYATRRAAERGEVVAASYLPEDLIFEGDPEEPWVPLGSSLIGPLNVNGRVIGTINLYHTQSDAFQADDMRVMAFVGEMAGQAVENARLFESTRESALTDNLTGLRNARFLHQFLGQEMSRSRRNHRPFAILGLDLDRFKSVNDNFGHERGDEVLRRIGQLFRTQVRQQDLVARNGGDEFVIVLPEADRGQAQAVAAKIAEAVDRLAEDLMRDVPGFPRIGVSIGTAVFPADGKDIQELMASADRGMYSDKRERQAA